MTFYSQNLSGANTKSYAINNALAINDFDVICFQETWFHQDTPLNEFNASTDYIIINRNRSQFQNRRSKVGGVAIFIKNSVDYNEIGLSSLGTTLIEIQAIRISIQPTNIVLIIVYIPPYSSRTTMVSELASIFKLITRFLPEDNILIFGDFNMPIIIWQSHEDHPGSLIATATKFKFENNFVELLTSFCMKQINHIASQFGKFLDLIIATDITNVTIQEAFGTQLLDSTTIHHPAFLLDLTYLSTTIKTIRKPNFSRINLKRAKRILNQHQYNTLNILNEHCTNQYTIVSDINNIIDSLNIIQLTCTSTRPSQHLSTNQYPWLNCKKYNRVVNARKILKKTLRFGISTFAKELIRRANINVRIRL